MSVRLGIERCVAGVSGCRRDHAVELRGALRELLGRAQLVLQPPEHQVIEAVEQRLQVVRAGARFGMALEAERRLVLEREALQRAVEQRAMRGAHVRRQRRLIHREAVVLAGDEHLAAVEVLHRMVGAVMAELHLHGLRAAGEAEDLVAEADAEHRHVGLEELARRLDGVVARLRIARAVGEEHAVRRQLQHFVRAGLRGHHRHAAAVIGEQAQDVALDAEVVGDDVQALLRADRRALRVLPDAALVPLDTGAWSRRPSRDPCPSGPGTCRAAFTAAFSSTCSPVMMQPDCAPFSRRRRVSLRVSMPAIATTLAALEELARAIRSRASCSRAAAGRE